MTATHTANMHDVLMKGVTCYKDVSEHDRVLQWEQWYPCPRWRAARFDQYMTPFRCGGLLLSLLGVSTIPHQGASLTPGGMGALSTWPSLCPPHKGASLTPGGVGAIST